MILGTIDVGLCVLNADQGLGLPGRGHLRTDAHGLILWVMSVHIFKGKNLKTPEITVFFCSEL